MSCAWAADGTLRCAGSSGAPPEHFADSPPPVATFLRTDAGAGELPRSWLLPDESLFSRGGRFMLTYELDGTLVVRPTALWQPNVTLQPAGRAVMQGDGNFVLYNSAGHAYWATYTANQGVGPFQLMVQGDRNVVLYDRSYTALWASGSKEAFEGFEEDEEVVDCPDEEVVDCPGEALTSAPQGPSQLLPGQSLRSADGRFDLVYQRDGNLVLYAQPTWTAAGVASVPRAGPGRASLLQDGRLVLSDATGRPYWTTGGAGVRGTLGPYGLLVTDHGTLLLISADLKIVWRSDQEGGP